MAILVAEVSPLHSIALSSTKIDELRADVHIIMKPCELVPFLFRLKEQISKN